MAVPAEKLNDELMQLKLNEAIDFEFYSSLETVGEIDFSFTAEHDMFCIIVNNTAATDDVVITIEKGDHRGALLGDLEFTVANTLAKIVGPLESSRFLTEDGEIKINVDMDGVTDDVDDVEIGLIFFPAFGVDRA